MIYVGTIGVTITLDWGEPLAGASAITIRYRKPSGVTGEWTAVLSGTDAIAYTTVEGDLDESGTWDLQGHLTLGGWTGSSTLAEMVVGEAIEIAG